VTPGKSRENRAAYYVDNTLKIPKNEFRKNAVKIPGKRPPHSRKTHRILRKNSLLITGKRTPNSGENAPDFRGKRTAYSGERIPNSGKMNCIFRGNALKILRKRKVRFQTWPKYVL
jgi:hypothetical protein